MEQEIRKTIGRTEKVIIIEEGESFSVNKMNLHDKILISYKDNKNLYLKLILDNIKEIKTIELENEIVYIFYKKDEIDKESPKYKIEDHEIYDILKNMKHLD